MFSFISHLAQTGGAYNLELPTAIDRQTEKPAVSGQRPRKGEAHRDSAVTPFPSGAEGTGLPTAAALTETGRMT